MKRKSLVAGFYLCPKIFILILICLVAFHLPVFMPGSGSAKAQQTETAPSATGFTENFDAVTAPQLPLNWTTATTGTLNLPFATTTATPNSAPNAVFTNNPATVGSSELVSPSIRVGGTIGGVSPKLIFRHFYDAESTFDGGVLEIKIGSGAFQDIVTAGGTFVTGAYNATINNTFGNPLGGRRAWSGNSGGYITTEINLPAAAHRQIIQIKWRFGTDNVIADVGWRIDNVQLTNTVSGENLNAISIPASGVSAPYPSEINISDHDGLITGVQVNLQNFTHTSPDDVDLILAAPNGRRVVLMSDVGGNNPVSNLALTFDDSAENLLPDSAPLVSGNYKPTNFEPGDIFPAPAPAGAPSGNLLSVLNGGTANGVWKLFLVDDNGENAGTISGGWSIAVQTAPDVISIPAVGTAQPYPSELLISGLPGSVTKATVTLSNFSHTTPDDVDILLVAPNGRRIVLMSDVGGAAEVGGLNLTFDDTAPSGLPDNAALTTGVFKPTNFEPDDNFPAPAPTGAPNGTTLNAFYGSAPNGAWKLFIVDDAGESIGSIAGSWSLNLQTSTSACLFTISPETQAFPIAGGNGSFSVAMPAGCPWTATTSAGFVGITSNTGGEGNGVVSFSVAPNMGGGRTATIDVTNGNLTRSFQVQQPSGCPFAVGQSAVNFGVAGGSGSVPVSAGSSCSWQPTTSANWIQITSAPTTGSGAATFAVQSNPGANARSAVINVGLQIITVNQSGATGRRFDFDGDGRADVSLFRPSSGVWWILPSAQTGTYAAAQFGLEADRLAPADYDGDRKTDLAVYRDGTWYIFQSQNGAVRIENWGLPMDAPVAADYDGDGRADLAVYRPSEGVWYVRRSGDSQYQAVSFGLAGDKPVPGDYDGDGKTDFAVYRGGASEGAQSFWATLQSSDGAALLQPFGSGGDIPVPADYDGDGRDNMAVFRPSIGTWYTSTNPATNYGARHWGMVGDVPVPADYNGDGRADLAVFRQGTWYILHLGSEEIRVEYWGVAGDKPAPAAYLPQ